MTVTLAAGNVCFMCGPDGSEVVDGTTASGAASVFSALISDAFSEVTWALGGASNPAMLMSAVTGSVRLRFTQ